uniref:Uncharacterized protein n=1 Tax=Oryza brachyantha TaxID=4533 RepID=J3LM19_ORYBR
AYVFQLKEAEFAEVGDGEVRRLRGDDDLHQLHRLRPHQIHRRAAPAPAARHGGCSRPAQTKPNQPNQRPPLPPPCDRALLLLSGGRARDGLIGFSLSLSLSRRGGEETGRGPSTMCCYAGDVARRGTGGARALTCWARLSVTGGPSAISRIQN